MDVTTDERMDVVSTQGFAYGYIASIIPFGISLAIIYLIGMDKALGFQVSFVITALWWGPLPSPTAPRKASSLCGARAKTHLQQLQTPLPDLRDIKKHRHAFLFLLTYFFYIDGVDTIIRMVVPYAQTIFGEDSMDIIYIAWCSPSHPDRSLSCALLLVDLPIAGEPFI